MIQCIYIPLTDSPPQKKIPTERYCSFLVNDNECHCSYVCYREIEKKKSKVTHLGQDRTKNDFSKIYSAFYENMVSKAISL